MDADWQVEVEALSKYLGASSPKRCSVVGHDQYARLIGDCRRSDGRSVSKWLVRNGHALDWPRHSGGKYNTFQLAARDDGVGIWIGDFEKPWDWRARQDQPTLEITNGKAPAAEQPFKLVSGGDCRIKGNIAPNGERIYHLPGQKYYNRITINRPAGERWFCLEAEVRKAG